MLSMPSPNPYDHGGHGGHHSRPEPMNASPHHPKVNVNILLPPDPVVIAGTHVSGKIELECKADRGLSLGVIKAELIAIEGESFAAYNNLNIETSYFAPSRAYLS